jgi:hypothetical protein
VIDYENWRRTPHCFELKQLLLNDLEKRHPATVIWG